MSSTNIEKLFEQLSEYNADPYSLLFKLEELYQLTINGYETEKPTHRGVVLKVWEKDPKTALSCIKLQIDLMKFAAKNYSGGSEKTQISLLPELK